MENDWNDLVKSQKSKTGNNPENKNLVKSYYFIFDCFNNEIEYINNTFQLVTGYDNAEFTIDKLLAIIHPDDFNYFLASEERGLKFTNSLSYTDHFRYQLSYTYRMLNSSNNYIWMRQFCQAIEVNEKGHLTKTLVRHQQIDDNYVRSANDYRILDKNTNLLLDINNIYNLSKREQEIVSLIHLGMNSVEIAQKLFVSKHTIDTHRKNILNKTNAKNFQELIRKLTFLDYA